MSEALDVGCHAVRNGKNVELELYARVISSSRESNTAKQHFVFADLLHGKHPDIEGVYEVWDGVKKWDDDSARFLGITERTSRLCRCVGSMKSNEAKWKLGRCRVHCWYLP